MKLHLDRAAGKNAILAHAPGAVTVNQQTYYEAIIVPSEGLVEPLGDLRFDELSSTHFAKLHALKPELILLGTGQQQRFAHPRLYADLAAQQIAVDCMTTAAACRTFSILVGEGRRCIALLLQ